MHVAADLCTQAVDDLVQRLRAGGVHVDEELVLVLVFARRTGLDVRQVDALLLEGGGDKPTDLGETGGSESISILLHFMGFTQSQLSVTAGLQQSVCCTTRGQCLTEMKPMCRSSVTCWPLSLLWTRWTFTIKEFTTSRCNLVQVCQINYFCATNSATHRLHILISLTAFNYVLV